MHLENYSEQVYSSTSILSLDIHILIKQQEIEQKMELKCCSLHNLIRYK